VLVSALAIMLPLVAIVVALVFAWTVYAVPHRVLRQPPTGISG